MSTIRVPEATGPFERMARPGKRRNEYFRSVRTPKKPFCFVIMPFNRREVPEDVYSFGIKQAVQESGFKCYKVGGAVFSQAFMNEVFSCIDKADFVIADLTGMNPNVLYELGIAHTLDKDVILISQNNPKKSPAADLSHLVVHVYEKGKIGELKELLKRAIEGFLNSEHTWS